jgi:peptidoglycan/LPS O-acetylase OafA/YrhL
MFGTLRLALAVVVVTFHAGVWPFGLYTGVSAVVVFYMLSGYVITALLTSRFQSGSTSYLSFLAERAVRLAPQYYFWIAVSFSFVFILNLTVIAPGKPSIWTVFSYLTLIPLALQRYTWDVDFAFIPQATSLAIEVIMYVIAPVVVRNVTASALLTTVYLAVFYASATGALPPTIYTYYTAPAPMLFFMLGSFIYNRQWTLLTLSTGAAFAILILGWEHRLYPEMLIGMAFGIPAMLLLKDKVGGRLDVALGNAAYGCFLCHMIIFDALVAFGMARGSFLFVVVSVALACLAGYAAYYIIERPTVRFRRRIGVSVGSRRLEPRQLGLGSTPP